MLKDRVLTALLLAPLAIAGLMFLPSGLVALASGAVMAIGAWEWGQLAGWSANAPRLAYALATMACLLATYCLMGWSWGTGGMLMLATTSILWWAIALYWVMDYQRSGVGIPRSRPLLALAGVLVVVPAWGAFVGLHQMIGGYLAVTLLLLVWAADSAAFFVGRRWGRHKLAERVSPGKTWEGVLGGLVVSAGVAWLGAWSLGYALGEGLQFLAVCLITVAFSVLGDLFESLVKRQAGVKDSGRLLPGHGGVLDRIDSLTAAAPIFALGVVLLGVRG